MEAKANYTLVGLIVIILIVSLLSAALWLSTGLDRKKYSYYTVYMYETISGLSDESPVKYNGVKVGYVDNIALSTFDPQQVKLTLKIVEGTPITANTSATLISQGITGTTYLGLAASSSQYTPLAKTPGEPYPIIPYKPSFFNQLEKNIDKIGKQVSTVLDKENTQNLKESLENLKKLSHALAKNNMQIDNTLKNMPMLVKNFDITAQRFTRMADSLYTAGNQVSITMKSGKRSIDQISQQTLPNLSDLIQKMNRIALNMEAISNEMRRNPAVIIRGATPLKPGPGE